MKGHVQRDRDGDGVLHGGNRPGRVGDVNLNEEKIQVLMFLHIADGE